jgi:hypothetical protein
MECNRRYVPLLQPGARVTCDEYTQTEFIGSEIGVPRGGEFFCLFTCEWSLFEFPNSGLRCDDCLLDASFFLNILFVSTSAAFSSSPF